VPGLAVLPLEMPWLEAPRLEVQQFDLPRVEAPRLEVLQRLNPVTLWSATP
jgi:hypothetical protein